MKILITGVAGFIGHSLAIDYLKNENNTIIGIDNFSTYSGKDIKRFRIKILKKSKNFKLINIDIKNKKKIDLLFKKNNFDIVVHLAAEVGVRYSIIRPDKYVEANINGFFQYN